MSISPARASSRWSSARPGRASRRCCGPSTGWCRTSPAGTSRAGSSRRRARHADTSAARVRRRPSASSVRIRWRASSPTRLRRSSPTRWSSSRSPPAVMRRRVEEVLDLLGIARLRRRALRTLSGGEQQRVAIGSVLTATPDDPGARRADVGARPGGRRGGARGRAPAGPRRRNHGGRGRAPSRASGRVRRQWWCSTAVGSGAARRRPDARARRWRRQSSSSAGWLAGPRCPCRFATRARPLAPLRDRLGGRRRRGTGRRPLAPARRRRRVRRAWWHRSWSSTATSRCGGSTSRWRRGEIVALMGRNGSGKSSLLWALQRRALAAGGWTVDGRSTRD